MSVGPARDQTVVLPRVRPEPSRVLVLGSGGREHSLVWGLTRSASVDEVLCAPGNPGIEALAECVPVSLADVDAVAALADDRDVDLVVVGPEQPLVDGVVDAVQRARPARVRAHRRRRAARGLEGAG